MRKIPYQSHSRKMPISVPLFTTTLVLPHIPQSWLSRQFRICDCHCGNFQLHCLFYPHCSISSCIGRSLPESPILHRKNPRCPSSPNKLTIGNLFSHTSKWVNLQEKQNWITINHSTHLELIETLTCLGMA
jgi:hypothetical protein